MNTTLHTLASIILLAGISALPADEVVIQPQIESIGVFKNGIAVVRASFMASVPGIYRWDQVPQAIHGTFSVDSETSLTSRATHRILEEDFNLAQSSTYGALAGKMVEVTFTGETNSAKISAKGRVWEAPVTLSNGSSIGIPERNPVEASEFLILETEQGREYINRRCILSIAADKPFDMIKRKIEKPVLLFEVSSGSGKVTISYLTRVMAWLPAYTLDISEPAMLSIRQSAVIRNELMNLKDTSLDLISGYPNIQFSHVDSAFHPDTSLATFFQQLGSQNGASFTTASQMVTSNSLARTSASPLPSNPESGSASSDIHYQSIGKKDLQRGDSLSLYIATEKTSYSRIVEWIVPISRDPDGRRKDPRAYHQAPDPEDQPWDALRFTNPFKFPMTTAPASILEAGKFRGQSLSEWVNQGQETTLRITQALSIRTQATEVEEENNRQEPKAEDVSWFQSARYQRIAIKGTLKIHNFRATAVPMTIRCKFSGKFIDADAKPTVVLLNESTSINPSSELSWSIPLNANEERTLHYRYHLWVSY